MKTKTIFYPDTCFPAWENCLDYLSAPHLLIAGSTGSGKSVLLNSIIFSALAKSPVYAQFIFIDLKRVELLQYAELPHTIRYADTVEKAIDAIRLAVRIMERRFTEMQSRSRPGFPVKTYSENGQHQIYIIIDEYADLITTARKQVENDIIRISQLGRAAGIHLIIATQRPTRDIIDGRIKVNLDTKIALRCPNSQASRNIIDVSGAEQLPRYGYGYYLKYGYLQKVSIPKTADSDIYNRVMYWLQFK